MSYRNALKWFKLPEVRISSLRGVTSAHQNLQDIIEY